MLPNIYTYTFPWGVVTNRCSHEENGLKKRICVFIELEATSRFYIVLASRHTVWSYPMYGTSHRFNMGIVYASTATKYNPANRDRNMNGWNKIWKTNQVTLFDFIIIHHIYHSTYYDITSSAIQWIFQAKQGWAIASQLKGGKLKGHETSWKAFASFPLSTCLWHQNTQELGRSHVWQSILERQIQGSRLRSTRSWLS